MISIVDEWVRSFCNIGLYTSMALRREVVKLRAKDRDIQALREKKNENLKSQLPNRTSYIVTLQEHVLGQQRFPMLLLATAAVQKKKIIVSVLS